jgi:hypothetical protein
VVILSTSRDWQEQGHRTAANARESWAPCGPMPWGLLAWYPLRLAAAVEAATRSTSYPGLPGRIARTL